MNHSSPQQSNSTWALVPVKRLSDAKSRLASILSAEKRADLQMAMLDDVLSALLRVKSLQGVAIVTGDRAVADFSRNHGCSVVDESATCGSLNVALNDGLLNLRNAGVTRALIVPADVPLIDVSEIDDVVGLGRMYMTLVIPDRDRTGTNGLLLHLDCPPQLAFGHDSFRKHLASTDRLAMQISAPSFELDIDTSVDLAEADRRCRGRANATTVAARTTLWMQTHLKIQEKPLS